MTDLSSLSDDDLTKMLAAAQGTTPGVATPTMAAAPAIAPSAALAGMSDDDLRAAITAQTPQMQGMAREAALPASAAAKGVLGSLGMGGMIEQAVEKPFYNYVTSPALKLITGNEAPPFNPNLSLLPTPQKMTDAGKSLGIVDRPDLVPQNAREKYEAAAAEGAGGTIPLALATGGASALPSLLTQGAGAGVGSQLGKDFAPKDSPTLQTLLSIGGGLLGGKVGSAGYTTAAKTVNAARGVGSDTLDAYNRLGIDTSLAGDVTGNPTLQKIQAFGAKSLGGTARIEQAGEKAVDGFSDAVDRTAANLGTSVTAQDAGTVLQTKARDWLDNIFPARQTAAWSPVDAAMRPGGVPVSVPLDNYRAALGNITGDVGRMVEQSKTLIPQSARTLLDNLKSDLPSGGPATWDEAQKLRSMVGDAMGVPEIAQSIGAKNLTRIYGSLASDMREAADARGAGAAFDAANKVSTEGFAFRNNTLSKVVSTNNPLQEPIRPEQAASSVLNGGDTTLKAIRREMPEAADELAAHKLRDMALANPGRQGATGTTTAPGTFLTDLNSLRLRSPGGAQALFGADPKTAQSVNDLATVSSAMKKTAERLNTSNTGPHAEIAAVPLMAGEGAYRGYEAAGLPGAIGGAVMGGFAPYAAGNVAARSVSNPTLTHIMAAPVQQPSAELSRLVRLSPNASALAQLLQQPNPLQRLP